MENKEDLLNLSSSKKNPKKFLIYGASAFLVFVIGVIVFAVVQGNSSSQNNTVIPPQVKEEPLFKEIPIEQNNTLNTDTENKTEFEKRIQKPQTQELIQKNPTPEKETTTSNIKNNEIKNVPAVQNNEAEIKPEVKTTYEKKVYAKKGKYYIQVAALMKYAKPNKKFLELIKKHGYNYKIYTVTVNKDGKKIKINKLLIGPFATKNEAKKELVKVKKQITQNAFIFKVK